MDKRMKIQAVGMESSEYVQELSRITGWDDGEWPLDPLLGLSHGVDTAH